MESKKIELVQYDPVTKRYTAQLIVTDGEKIGSYTCEGTWYDEDADMVADALYDQHKVKMKNQVTMDAEKASIIAKITAAVEKAASLVEDK